MAHLFSDAVSKIEEFKIDFSISKYSCDAPTVKVGSATDDAYESAQTTRQVWEDRQITVTEKVSHMIFFEKDVEVGKTVRVSVDEEYHDDDEFRRQIAKNMKKRFKKAVERAEDEIEDAISRFCNAFDRQVSSFMTQRYQYVKQVEEEQQQGIEADKAELQKCYERLRIIDAQLQIIIPLIPSEGVI